MKVLLFTLVLLITCLGHTNPLFDDFKVIKKSDLNSLSFNPENIIHETQEDFLIASPLTNFESYDYYYIQTTEDADLLKWLHLNNNIVLDEKNYMIAEIRNQVQLREVASRVHSAGHFCGLLQKLSPHPISLVKEDPPKINRTPLASVVAATERVNIDNILETMDTMVAWNTRFEGSSVGQMTSQRLKEIYQTLIPEERDDVEIELIEHTGSDQNSILVRIIGQKNPDKVVILGSHIDSINKSNNADAPGADDNASGTATNIEIFRVLMESGYKPQNTIEIHGYAAEEIGLVGSKEMAESYKKNRVNVLAMVQIDMNAFASNGDKITFVTNSTNRELTSQLVDLAKNYSSIPVTTGFLLFGSSDHASWNSQGFPVAFPTEDPFGFNRKIHTKDDTLANINSPNQIKEFAKLGVAYLMHFTEASL